MKTSTTNKILGWLSIIIASIIGGVIILVSIIRPTAKINVDAKSAAIEAESDEVLPPVKEAIPEQELVVNTTEVEPVISLAESEPSEGATEEMHWHFYNLDLQEDGTLSNDFNFGKSPLSSETILGPLAAEAEAKNFKGSIEIENTIKNMDPKIIDDEFRSRMREDPALGAADMAWFDSIMGTRYLGVFYDECDSQWDAAMNMAKEQFIADPDMYNNRLDAFFKYLDKATKIEITRQDKGLTDQMYMNPATEDGIPDIIVMETADHQGWFIKYTFTIKETTTKEISYRMDCGYQPTNVAKIMKVKVKPNPNNTEDKKKKGGGQSTTSASSSPSNPNPNPSNPSNPDKPGGKDPKVPDKPKPDPYDKDPTKGTPVLPNDVPGPGESTNTGPGGQYSSKDKVGNSNDLTPQEYADIMKDLEEANKISREAGDPNTPSTPTPPDTTVHSNAENGTGYGGIDTPTPVAPSSVSNDTPGDHWDGPADK